MGGYSSGVKPGRIKTTKIDELLDFNINEFMRLKPDGYSKVRYEWRTGDKVTSSIIVKLTNSKKLIFKYGIPSHGNIEPIELEIPLKRQACHFGGFRHWIECPFCSNQCAVVYLQGKYFKCRKCLKLLYACQSESANDRLYRKARKLRCKLKANNDLTQPSTTKPKGMSWKKYETLKNKSAIATNKATLSSISRILKSGFSY